MSTVFFTGFPGFLGSALLPPVLDASPDASAVCIVQPKFAGAAKKRVDDLRSAHPALEGRVRLVEGDITQPGLGLINEDTLLQDTTAIYHLAAVYDLAVPREVGMQVNVEGTRNMLKFAEDCGKLDRFQYISTCYVSGRYTGAFKETDLNKGQSFNNFYEETKYLAEVDVQNRMADGLPASIYRPSIVVGNSKTGATQKYDGPYFVIRFLLRQPHTAVLPMVGDPTMTRLNVVPSNFVVDAIAHLSAQPDSAGKVFQLADPEPLTITELVNEIERATDRRVIRIPLPRSLAKWAIKNVPGADRIFQMPAESLDYFVHPTHYDTTNTQTALEGTGIAVPPFASYLDRLVTFVREHPDISSAAMV